jgi:hypothetical protein
MTPDVDLLPPPEEAEDLAPPPEEELAVVAAVPPAALARVAELLPADSPLPLLLKFLPNPALRQAADADAQQLLALTIVDDRTCQQVDQALARQRGHKTIIEAHFEEPVRAAFTLHRALTTQRGDFLDLTDRAIKTGGERIWAFNKQRERDAAEARRQLQEEADRLAREAARRETEAARAAGAPPSLIEQLEQSAQTITAPPVSAPVTTPRETLKTTTVIDTWKVRLEGTEPSAMNPQPEKTAEMTDPERASVLKLLRAIVDGKAPLSLIRVDWTTANARVKADKGTLQIPGLVPYQAGGTRGKSTRVR